MYHVHNYIVAVCFCSSWLKHKSLKYAFTNRTISVHGLKAERKSIHNTVSIISIISFFFKLWDLKENIQQSSGQNFQL